MNEYVFDNAADAVAAAKRIIYISPDQERMAMEQLECGDTAYLVYGFRVIAIETRGSEFILYK